MTREHGGPDAQGGATFDFSTNANAYGPCPFAHEAVAQANAMHYPDPHYTQLRLALAQFHTVNVERVVLATSASEFIARITAWVARAGGHRVCVPAQAYGDYASAAQACGLQIITAQPGADLQWLCEPSNPLGAQHSLAGAVKAPRVVVLDRAYEPLRLSGQCSFSAAALEQVWQLWSPNKALALTGVRGAYAIAPVQAQHAACALEKMAASWPLGAHAVAMLSAWVQRETQQWLAESHVQLTQWKTQQQNMLETLDWRCLPSQANYFCAQAPMLLDETALRQHGIKLRDTRTLGLPGYWRLRVHQPRAQAALRAALLAQPKALA
jgi:histidinol-phosphate aminotransferase